MGASQKSPERVGSDPCVFKKCRGEPPARPYRQYVMFTEPLNGEGMTLAKNLSLRNWNLLTTDVALLDSSR